jgi:transposase InsO family protein
VSHDIRDAVVDFIQYWSLRTEISQSAIIRWIPITSSKFYSWKKRYGKVNEHNGWIPRDFWLEDWEKQAIIDYRHSYPHEGYRRLTYMMMDDDVVAVSPSSVYRVLFNADLLGKWSKKNSKKGTGFVGPLRAHEQWHIDISYLNIKGTFYYLTSILDGYSRFIVHWDIRESMTEKDVAIVVQKAKEMYPNEKPRIISDNGQQFIAKDFKELIRILGMSHVTTSTYYPQSNGKKERFYGTLKRDCIRPKTPLSLEEAKSVVAEFISYYNTKRLHAAIGYITPTDKLQGREKEIFAERDRKLAEARSERKAKRSNNKKTQRANKLNQAA